MSADSDMVHYSASDLASLDRRALQKLCKRADVAAWAAEQEQTIKANAKNSELIAQLTKFFEQQQQQQQQHNQADIGKAMDEEQEEDAAEPAVEAEPAVADASVAEATHEEPAAAAAAATEEIDEVAEATMLDTSVSSSSAARRSRRVSSFRPPRASDFPLLPPEEGEHEDSLAEQEQALQAELEGLEAKLALEQEQRDAVTAAAAAAPASAAVAAIPAPAAASRTASMEDAYWSLMAELDKRVSEKTSSAPMVDVAGPASSPSMSKTPGGSLAKKTTAKFNKIHAKASEKQESIVDHYNKLNDKKKRTAAQTPLIGNKRPKIAVAAGAPAASPAAASLPAASPARSSIAIGAAAAAAPFVFAPLSSPSFAQGTSGKTPAASGAAAAGGVAKRTRLSMQKAKLQHKSKLAVPKPAPAVASIARKSVAAPKLAAPEASPAAASVASSSRPLFSSRIPGRKMTTTGAGSVAPPSGSSVSSFQSTSTNLSFAPLSAAESARAARAANASANARARRTTHAPVFDLAASLSKPLSWKPHKGAIGKTMTMTTTAPAVAAAAANSSKPTAAATANPFVMPAAAAQSQQLQESTKENGSKPAAEPFTFSFGSGAAAGGFGADISNTIASSSSSSSVATKGFSRGASQPRGDIKSAGVARMIDGGKESRRTNFQSKAQQARAKAAELARSNRNKPQMDAPMDTAINVA
jgi:hypothetical protein